MNERSPPIQPRRVLTIVYAVWLALLVYAVYGAATGTLVVPGRNSVVRVWGWAAWLACLVPILLAAETYVRLDPHVELAKPVRIALSVFLLIAVAAVIFAVFHFGVV